MSSASTRFVPARRMGLYEPVYQMAMWEDFKGKTCLDESPPFILDVDNKLENQSDDISHGTVGPSDKFEQDTSKPDKVSKRLAQNREAARKSRMRKKAYVQQLENCNLRLLQLEQELQCARQQEYIVLQGLYVGAIVDSSQLTCAGNMNPAIATFEMEYAHWVEELNRQRSDLGNALQSNIGDFELQFLVDEGIRHYYNLFVMKATAAKADVFYVMSGMWQTPAERFFFWIGGFRPSEILKILLPHLKPLSEQQHLDVCNLGHSCQQAEEALSQGMDKFHVSLAETVAEKKIGERNYAPHIRATIEKFEDLVRFVVQADHLRQETLHQLLRILTTHQAARALLALGEYFERLRTLSSVWSSRPRESI